MSVDGSAMSVRYLAATDFSTRSNRALRQAGLLAKARNAELHLVHVVDDDQPDELVGIEKTEAQRILLEQTNSIPELRGVQCRPLVITGDPFDGILRSAADISADLIVMGSHRKQFLLDIFVGTTIERVIRQGRSPVLMVNNEAQKRYENVVMAVDMSEASANAVRAAKAAGMVHERATILHAFSALAKGKMLIADPTQSSIDSYVASERKEIMDELVEFMVANDLAPEKWSLRLEEGGPMEVISRFVSEKHADLLVMGTHGRSGLLKALLASVTEEALRSLNVDILAVPPPKPRG
jgi:nucleotide-binding universal stress UspA family protein